MHWYMSVSALMGLSGKIPYTNHLQLHTYIGKTLTLTNPISLLLLLMHHYRYRP